MNLTKPFNRGLGKWMRKATHPSGGVDSLNPCRWRGKRLHHHGGGVCWLFVLLWMDLWRHKLIVCKIWYKNNLKMRLAALLFDPPTCAPYQLWGHTLTLGLPGCTLQCPAEGGPSCWPSTPQKRFQCCPPCLLWRCFWKCPTTEGQPSSQWRCIYWTLFSWKGGHHLTLSQVGP